MSTAEKLTPMMQQYFEVRRGLSRDTLLLFRLGDFYEMFFEDAEVAAKLLGITLTKRQDHPMAGIPFHAADNYVGKLLAAGKKVAICDQAEPAKAGKLVRRQLSRILSPGTTLAANQLDAQRNRYLAALKVEGRAISAAWLELSTGEFQVARDEKVENLLPVLSSISPSEVLLAENVLTQWQKAPHDRTDLHALAQFCSGRTLTELPAYHFETEEGARQVLRSLGVLNLDAFGLDPGHSGLGPAGALVYYATENLCAKPENLRSLREYRSAHALLLDPATLRNLEVFQSTRGDREGSVLQAINRTQTAPGARLLEQWLGAPTLELAEVSRRQRAVGELIDRAIELPELTRLLTGIRDLPRIVGRLQNRLRNPRELGAVRDSLKELPPLRQLLGSFPNGGPVQAYAARIQELPALLDLLEAALAPELPTDLEEGGIIRPGYDAELDRLRALTTDNRTWLTDLERKEQERTGIRSLKVRFTGNFGYYIEVTKANLSLVPADYIRRQTTVNGERYVTEELRAKEREIFHAEENALTRERDLFQTLVASCLAEAPALLGTAEALAELDVLIGWANLAREWGYVRPEVDDSDVLEIQEGRHPVVEQMLKRPSPGGPQAFVPNDTALSCSEAQIGLITGPNMAGKSTYIRQVALITLMAQIGSWVPAARCRIGRVDRIFSRVGASDDLARGNSTFMVEMNETANILNHATSRSLIILDEIGRGTSTYDGLSIAWAVVEHLHGQADEGPRTLFATHYQELTQLEKHLGRLRNLSVVVKEWNDEIVFVRRVVTGAADRSYGIQVARLAGLPLTVIERAKSILTRLEAPETETTLPAPAAKPRKRLTVAAPADQGQLDLL